MFSLGDTLSFLPKLLDGAVITILVSVVSYVLAALLGLLIGMARMTRFWPVRVFATVYIQLIRGTPLLLQLFSIYYVLPYGGIVLSPFVAGVLGLTINYAAYMAEVFRSGIQAIPREQWEAARSLGMSRKLLMRRIVLPQAIRIVIPALGNFFISIFKDSALVSVISMRDLMFTGELLASATFKYFEIFALVALIYFAISYPVAKLVDYVERQFDMSRGRVEPMRT